MTLSTPTAIQERLEEIEKDLAARQLALESAALNWFKAKRDREKEYAKAFIAAPGPVDQRKATATLATAHIGLEAEAEYESLNRVVRVLETRSTIGMSLLRAHGRGA